ncbi:hypothetical protein DSLASN_09820 [Desulfoluna limicola]|uniref:Uncharacterized protein n=1 Tax=Desulfoluna limicola TaxID=2810562 RepID=A0ABM7PCP3_9BACT|nr:hypothetical protein DSLASN_09820 [Desulfoluna limicola]
MGRRRLLAGAVPRAAQPHVVQEGMGGDVGVTTEKSAKHASGSPAGSQSFEKFNKQALSTVSASHIVWA